MQISNPTQSYINSPGGLFRHLQSVFKAFNGGFSEAEPIGQDSQGVYNKFQQDNSNGVMLRVGGLNSQEAVKWQNGAPVTINHGLGRQPIGFKVYDKDKFCDVMRVGTPNSNTITLQSSDATASTTIYVF